MGIFSYVSIGKIIKKRKIRIDNLIFTLHYRLTFALFFMCSLLVGAKEFFGAPIMCHTKSKSVKGMLNTYCYIMSTFSIPTNRNHTVGKIAYHGVGSPDTNDEIAVHSYYIWVPMMLFLQAVMFYLPHFIWKKIDNHVYENLVPGIDKFSLELSSKEEKIKGIVQYLMNFMNTHDIMAIKFYVCEVLNFINAVGNIYFIDKFLGGTFLTYGTDVLNYPDAEYDSRVDPMTRIFPKMAKCTFRKFGPTATLETHDAFCLLAVNIINEKIYIFLWFWLVFLCAITGVWILFRMAVMFLPGLRKWLLKGRGKMAGPQNINIVADRCRVGDWFLVYQLGSHMEPSVYGEFLKEFSKEIQNSVATLERKPMLMS